MNWYADGDLNWSLGWFGFDGSNTVDPYGPAGVGTLVLDLENGFKVKHRWPVDVQKFQSGKERRISRNDAPQESYSGAVVLLGDQPRNVRATLARHAALGSQFLMALPHEALSISEVSGTTVTVPSTANRDWTVLGQRVVCTWLNDDDETQYVEGTIQAVTPTTLELDISPDAEAFLIMPTRPIYLESQQTFARYPTEVEVWQLESRAAIFDFAPSLASLALDALTVSAAFDGVVIYARDAGAVGNTRTFELSNSSPFDVVSEADGAVTYRYEAGVTTLAEMAATLASSQYVLMGGSFTGTDTIAAGDAFSAQALTGGATAGAQGQGASVTEYDGDGTSRPVWDRELLAHPTATDSIQAMTEIIDHGALPYAIGTADEPDWGRAISFLGEDADDWQWLKLFFATTLGPQKAFWLPTWRDDLTPISHAPGDPGLVDIDISTEDGSDFTAWWPNQREHVQILLTTGDVEYAQIVDAIDNGDGTRTISVALPSLTGTIETISWLELCRFESSEFEFSFGEHGVEIDTTARVVQQ